MADAEKEKEKESKNKKQRSDEPHVSLENPPFDSVMEMEILPRLPLKSILRLELASKPLSPLISDFLRRRYSLPNAAAGLFFRWPISETPTQNFYHALDSKFVIDDTIMTLPPYIEMTVIDCCNGLLLCQTINMSNETISFVCNPLTGQWASVRKSNHVTDDLDYVSIYVKITHDVVLAFDPHTSHHYNILQFDSGMVHVYSSETRRWVRKRGPSHKPQVLDIYPFFFDGKVYLASRRQPFVKIFNRQGKLVGRINLPHPAPGNNEKRLLGHSGGRMHYAAKVDDKMLVWILDDPDKSGWVLKHSVSLQYIVCDAAGPSRWGHYLLRFHPDMDVIFIEEKNKLFSYNMDNGNFTKVCTFTKLSYTRFLACSHSQSVFAYSPYYSKDFNLLTRRDVQNRVLAKDYFLRF